MIYACLNAARECPSLFLWNIGAWGILAMLASDSMAIALARASRSSLDFWAVIPPDPIDLWINAAFSPVGLAIQVGIVAAGCSLMLFAVGRGIYRRSISHH